jgi:pterin-4a-carbinolamine dehydratase
VEDDGEGNGGRLNREWAAALGARAGSGRFARDRLGGRALEATLRRLPRWRLVHDDGQEWLAIHFDFPVFEAAALFVNFLFASVQMTTCRVAPAVAVGGNGELAVRLTDPAVGGVTEEVAFFARLLERGFFLDEDKPHAGADGDGGTNGDGDGG